MRKPVVSGQFYEADSEKLKKGIESLLKSQKIRIEKKIIGLIAPHAGYFYSGDAAASSYSQLKARKTGTFVILGTNHSGFESFVSSEDFETPLGIAKNDAGFSKEISKIIGKNESQDYEHSIEVQIPFIQCVSENAKIVPIIIGSMDYEKCMKIAGAIIKTAKKQKKKICIIASSDFTHYGAGYGYVPFSGKSEEVRKKMYELDRKAIAFIEKMDSKGFFEFSKNMTICGRIPITIAIEACKTRGAKAKLLKYYTSGDITKDYGSAVGYASIVFTN